MTLFWLIFGYAFLISVLALIAFGILDWLRRRVKAPRGEEDILYTEMARPVKVNRFPFKFTANISISSKHLILEPNHLYDLKGHKSMPKISLEISHLKNLTISEDNRFSVSFEYPQKFGVAVWELGFLYPYSARQCLIGDGSTKEPEVPDQSFDYAAIDEQPGMSLR